MENSSTERILSAAGLLNDYSLLFARHKVEGEVWCDLTTKHLIGLGITNKRHIETILSKRDELFGVSSEDSSFKEESKIEAGNEVIISFNSMVKAARLQTKNKTDSGEIVLRKVKSLDFSNRNLTRIDNIGRCSSLQFLSLNHNSIIQIAGLSGLKQLRILSLESNLLQRLENLSDLSMLEKLYIDMNFLRKVEGLEALGNLQELTISNQQTATPLEFDEASVVAVSRSLRKFASAGNRIEDIGVLWYLDSLLALDLANNNITFCEELYNVLTCLKVLNQLKLAGNPVAKRLKYRDEMVMWSHNLQELDGKDILANEKEYIYRLKGKKLTTFPKPKNKENLDFEVKGRQFNN